MEVSTDFSYEVSGDAEADSDTGRFVGQLVVELGEGFEDRFGFVGRDSGPVIADGYFGVIGMGDEFDFDEFPVFGVFRCVVD